MMHDDMLIDSNDSAEKLALSERVKREMIEKMRIELIGQYDKWFAEYWHGTPADMPLGGLVEWTVVTVDGKKFEGKKNQ